MGYRVTRANRYSTLISANGYPRLMQSKRLQIRKKNRNNASMVARLGLDNRSRENSDTWEVKTSVKVWNDFTMFTLVLPMYQFHNFYYDHVFRQMHWPEREKFRCLKTRKREQTFVMVQFCKPVIRFTIIRYRQVGQTRICSNGQNQIIYSDVYWPTSLLTTSDRRC